MATTRTRRPVILVTEPEYFRSVLPDLRKIGRVVPGSTRKSVLAHLLPRSDAALIRVETVLDGKLLRAAPNLKLIASATTGINHIDGRTARAMGIRIVHLHGTHTRPTAEHAVGLMLALLRNIPASHAHLLRGGWDRARWIGSGLSGKTLGIIGLGRIGTAVSGLARPFGMTVIAYDPYVRGRRNVRMIRGLAELLRKSDVVSIHAALTAETKNMIDRKALFRIRRGAFLINTARGEIVNDQALLSALRRGILAGAALDVYDREPLPAGSPLRRYAKQSGALVLTPHLGASTADAVSDAAREMARAVRNFFS